MLFGRVALPHPYGEDRGERRFLFQEFLVFAVMTLEFGLVPLPL